MVNMHAYGGYTSKRTKHDPMLLFIANGIIVSLVWWSKYKSGIATITNEK